MSTRGNVAFLEYELDNMNQLSSENFADYPTIYIHSDMYPEGALPMILDFVETKGAAQRSFDPAYLSAWFVAFVVNRKIRYVRNKYEESAEDTGFRYIKEIRRKLSRSKKRLKELVESNNKEYLYAYEVQEALQFNLNKFIKEVDDFTGVGLQTRLNDWCDYTYVIVPQDDCFRIYMYDGELSLIGINDARDWH